MKKLFAILLAMIMVMTLLTACGNKDDKDDDKKTTSASQEKDDDGNNSENKQDEDKDDDKDDDEDKDDKDEDKNDNKDPSLLKAPKVTLKTDELDIFFSYEGADGTEIFGQIVVIDDASPAQLFYSIGDEIILYEQADDGTITKKIYDEDNYKYVADTSASQSELKNETDIIIQLLTYSGWKFTQTNPDISYRLTEEPDSINAAIYGGVDSESTWYELVQKGKTVGYVSVDNTTGVFNYLESGNFFFSVSMSETEDVEIPFLY